MDIDGRRVEPVLNLAFFSVGERVVSGNVCVCVVSYLVFLGGRVLDGWRVVGTCWVKLLTK